MLTIILMFLARDVEEYEQFDHSYISTQSNDVFFFKF